MSCKNCNKFQDEEPYMTTFYRWKYANIEMRCCEEHLKEIFEELNQVQKDENDSGFISM